MALYREKTKVSTEPFATRKTMGASEFQKSWGVIAEMLYFFCVSGANLLLRGEKPHLFLLGHSHGTDWVEYNAHGWLSHAKHNPAAQNAATLLQDSQK